MAHICWCIIKWSEQMQRLICNSIRIHFGKTAFRLFISLLQFYSKHQRILIFSWTPAFLTLPIYLVNIWFSCKCTWRGAWIAISIPMCDSGVAFFFMDCRASQFTATSLARSIFPIHKYLFYCCTFSIICWWQQHCMTNHNIYHLDKFYESNKPALLASS